MSNAKLLIDLFNHSSTNNHLEMIKTIDRLMTNNVPTVLINKVLALSHRCNEVEQPEETINNLLLTVA